MTKKRMSWGVTIALMAITAAVTISLTYQFAMARFNERVHSINERQKMYAKLQEVDQKVRQNYFGAIDEQLLNDSIADGYMQGTGDAHSRYMTVEEYRTMQSELEGQTVGVGLEAALRAGVRYALDVYPHYSSDADVAVCAGNDVRHCVVGAGVYASHGYERSHIEGLANTFDLLNSYIETAD